MDVIGEDVGQQAVYQRRTKPPPVVPLSSVENPIDDADAPLRRPNPWRNRSLSVRGRLSIAVKALPKDFLVKRPGPNPKGKVKGRGKPPIPSHQGRCNFEKERQYFEEVDDFELQEESPSPLRRPSTWTSFPNPQIPVPPLSSALHTWLIRTSRPSPSTTLSKLLETPAPSPSSYIPGPFRLEASSTELHSVASTIHHYLRSATPNPEQPDIDVAFERLSLKSSRTSLAYVDPFATLLAVCGQPCPISLIGVISSYCDPESIVKVGEGSYGEVFIAGGAVCKIVPFNGDFKVNGETQKRAEELLEEVVLSKTLNNLRMPEGDHQNACTSFIETLDLKVCSGTYDQSLIKAWDLWDEKHGSENDHPKDFPENQHYVVFALNHGGKDLESFVLKDYDEARSLLVQVTAALAVAEAAFEFEHRDLHWGNILLSRKESFDVSFTLEGEKMSVITHGLMVSIIDFTLSRINTGEDILYLDLTTDPYIFKGPKGDKQAETYRKMKEVVDDSWEGSFPRTNVLWLLYLVDILLLKKSFSRSSKDERELRSLKKRLDKYDSAKEAIGDQFFQDMIVAIQS